MALYCLFLSVTHCLNSLTHLCKSTGLTIKREREISDEIFGKVHYFTRARKSKLTFSPASNGLTSVWTFPARCLVHPPAFAAPTSSLEGGRCSSSGQLLLLLAQSPQAVQEGLGLGPELRVLTVFCAGMRWTALSLPPLSSVAPSFPAEVQQTSPSILPGGG